jgi:hypothetical protein
MSDTTPPGHGQAHQAHALPNLEHAAPAREREHGAVGEDGAGGERKHPALEYMGWGYAPPSNASSAGVPADVDIPSTSSSMSSLQDRLDYQTLGWAKQPRRSGKRGRGDGTMSSHDLGVQGKMDTVERDDTQMLDTRGVGVGKKRKQLHLAHDYRLSQCGIAGAESSQEEEKQEDSREEGGVWEGGWWQGWREDSPMPVTVPAVREQGSRLRGAPKYGSLPEALRRGGGAESLEAIHVRAGQHMVRAPRVLTVESRRNVTILAEPHSFVWGQWYMGEASRGHLAGAILLLSLKGEAGYEACLSLAGAGPWRLTSTNVLAVSATPVLLASGPPPPPPPPRHWHMAKDGKDAANSRNQANVPRCGQGSKGGKGRRRGGGSSLVLHGCWVGGLGGKSGQRAVDGVVVLAHSVCLLLASVVSDTGEGLGAAVVARDSAVVKLKFSCLQRSRLAIAIAGSARVLAVSSLFQHNKRSVLPPSDLQARQASTDMPARRVSPELVPSKVGPSAPPSPTPPLRGALSHPSLWLVRNRVVQGYNETMWWRHKDPYLAPLSDAFLTDPTHVRRACSLALGSVSITNPTGFLTDRTPPPQAPRGQWQQAAGAYVQAEHGANYAGRHAEHAAHYLHNPTSGRYTPPHNPTSGRYVWDSSLRGSNPPAPQRPGGAPPQARAFPGARSPVLLFWLEQDNGVQAANVNHPLLQLSPSATGLRKVV